jgi:putative pyruvate formate lyase activating enzyme
MDISNCDLCPRKCGINRRTDIGPCGGGELPVIARAALHKWEEPCISGEKGSGTVFFCGCNLKCVFCQNYSISHNDINNHIEGKEVTKQNLIDIFKRLEEQGAHNINLVTPTHYSQQIFEALSDASLSIPVVWNSSGYERVEILKQLEGLVDIYLPDIKYYDKEISLKYAGVSDYFETACNAVLEMNRQTGNTVIENGIMKKGIIIRHLILLGHTIQAMKILKWIKENLPEEIYVSLMGQYTPVGKACDFPEINRSLKRKEYKRVADYMISLDFQNGYLQELSSVGENYIPSFGEDIDI